MSDYAQDIRDRQAADVRGATLAIAQRSTNTEAGDRGFAAVLSGKAGFPVELIDNRIGKTEGAPV